MSNGNDKSQPGRPHPGGPADFRVTTSPPRLALALAHTVLPLELRDDVLGDLQEGFVWRLAENGGSVARRWYWRQALQSLRYARDGSANAPDPSSGRRTPRLRAAFMGFFRYDLGYAVRQLRANPGFTAVAVLSLALGIGVNSTIFTVINSFLLKPLPVANIDEVIEVFSTSATRQFRLSSYPNYVDYRDEVEAFDGLAANMTMLYSWNRETHSETLFGELVSGNYFHVLGIEPAHGRWFLPEEDRTPGTHPVAVLGHGFWERHFGGDPSIVGDTIKLNGTHFTVVGIAPAEFIGMTPVLKSDLFTPLMTESIVNIFSFSDGISLIERRGGGSLRIYGRLADGATIDQARAQLETVATRLAAEYPGTNENRSVNVKPLREVRINPEADGMVTPVAGLLMGLVAMVLLVACANVANMLLARGSARRREIGVRLALGASRWRLVRQLLTESILLSLLGGAGALILTYWISRLLATFQPPLPILIVLDVSPDARVLGFTVGATLLTGIVFGLAPALRSSKPDLVATLKEDAPAARIGGWFSLRNALVVAQIAVSLVLLVTAGLFARSLGNARSIELGFDETNIAFVSTSLSSAGYSREEGRQFLRQTTERIGALPGVVAATYTARLPMNLTNASQDFFIEGYEPDTGDPSVTVTYNGVGPRYFEILGIPLLAGREIAETDDSRAPLVAVVNKSFVDAYWPGQNAIGQRLKFNSESDPWITVVGVSADYKMQTIGELPEPMVHTSLMQQMPFFFDIIMVRTEGNPGPMVDRMREEITALDPGISFFDARTMDENLAVVLLPARMGAALLAVFGLLALGLAAVGVYGVIAYSVSRRTHEIGFRIALGARSNDVLGMVVSQGMKVVLVGVVLGLLGAMALSTALGGLLYDVSAVDPVAFLGTAAILVLVALLANYIPARRAARVDPMVALRSE